MRNRNAWFQVKTKRKQTFRKVAGFKLRFFFFYTITIAYPSPDQKLENWYLFWAFIDEKHWLLQNYLVFWELWLSQSFVKIHQSNFTLQACLNNNVLVSLLVAIRSYQKWLIVGNILWIKGERLLIFSSIYLSFCLS